eukprot:1824956-Rhodomonas_salina.1
MARRLLKTRMPLPRLLFVGFRIHKFLSPALTFTRRRPSEQLRLSTHSFVSEPAASCSLARITSGAITGHVASESTASCPLLHITSRTVRKRTARGTQEDGSGRLGTEEDGSGRLGTEEDDSG